jgi:hypothetical protein
MPVHDWTRVDAGLFHSFHVHWISALCDVLNTGGLPNDYYALIERSIHGPIPEDPVLHLAAEDWESAIYAHKANRVAVRHRHGQIVAVVEIVSPGNKRSNSELRAFVQRTADLIQQGVHVLVVDLFPPAQGDPQGLHKAIWDEFADQDFALPAEKPLTLASYSAGPIKEAYVEPVAVGDVLPGMPLFLEGEACVPVPLEATYETSWESFPAALKGLLEPATASSQDVE